jgi:hypothetical protein
VQIVVEAADGTGLDRYRLLHDRRSYP